MREVIDSLLNNDDGFKLSFVLTGGGSRVISKILENGGGSNVLDEAIIPYSQENLEAFIGPVEKSVSLETIRAMRRRFPYRNGVYVSASLKKDNEREDRLNHAYVGFCVIYLTMITYVTFDKSYSRFQQEDDLANYILSLISLYSTPEQIITKYCPSILNIKNEYGEVIYDKSIPSKESV